MTTTDWWDGGPPGLPGSQTTTDICRAVLGAAVSQLNCLLASAWAVDPVNRELVLVDVVPRVQLAPAVIRCGSSMSGTAVERNDITRVADLSKPDEDGRLFAHPALVAALGLTRMVSVPVVNVSNLHQVLLVVNLFPGPGTRDADLADATLHRMAEELAVRVESALRERCERFANRLGIELGRDDRPRAGRLCTTLARLAVRAVGCDHADVFVEEEEDDKTRKLVWEAEADADPNPPTRSPDLPEPARVSWQANRERLVGPSPTGPAVVAVPLRDADGQAKGIVCCTNRPGGHDHPFTYDDVAVIEAVGRAFLPHLTILRAFRQRDLARDKLLHELMNPVVALRAVLEEIQTECTEKGYTFTHNYFNDVTYFTGIMDRELNKLVRSRTRASRLVPVPRREYLLASVIAPAKKHTRKLLKDRQFNPGQIQYSGLDGFRLWHDPGLMLQVVFNLLDNAIKYYHGAPDKFAVEIVGEATDEWFTVVFRDRGIGVPEGMENAIFELGVRAPNAHEYNVTGTGYGLWLAREIVRCHNGTLTVRRNSNPTEFEIRLPARLAHSLPTDPTEDGP